MADMYLRGSETVYEAARKFEGAAESFERAVSQMAYNLADVNFTLQQTLNSFLEELRNTLENAFPAEKGPEKPVKSENPEDCPKFFTKRIYIGTPEMEEYVKARFCKQSYIPKILDVFPLWGHNWRYSHTYFDDIGKYDVIERPNPDHPDHKEA